MSQKSTLSRINMSDESNHNFKPSDLAIKLQDAVKTINALTHDHMGYREGFVEQALLTEQMEPEVKKLGATLYTLLFSKKAQSIPMEGDHINEEQAKKILLDDRPAQVIADEQMVAVSTVHSIKAHKTWKQLRKIKPVKPRTGRKYQNPNDKRIGKPQARLAEYEAQQILDSDMRHQDLADKYGCSRATIRAIKQGYNFKHLKRNK